MHLQKEVFQLTSGQDNVGKRVCEKCVFACASWAAGGGEYGGGETEQAALRLLPPHQNRVLSSWMWGAPSAGSRLRFVKLEGTSLV